LGLNMTCAGGTGEPRDGGFDIGGPAEPTHLHHTKLKCSRRVTGFSRLA
jgi:hypothetical protein